MQATLDATVAKDKVSIPRSEVKKESRLQKILAMLANTVLTFKTTSHENIHTRQINIPANSDYPVNVLAANENRTSVVLRNVGGNDAYIGSYNVTTTTGFLLRNFESITLDKTWGAIFAVSAAGSTIAYLEE